MTPAGRFGVLSQLQGRMLDNSARIHLSNNTTFPDPRDPQTVAWRMIHDPEAVTRADMMWAASVIAAYGYLVLEMTQRQRNAVCEAIKRTIRESIIGENGGATNE